MVIATKYSLFTEPHRINDGGNHRKNLIQSLEKSLKRLQMDYVDILYLHAWDFSTPIDEVLRSLEYLVQSGKVLHIGFSDTPAWIVAQAYTIAQFRGYSNICALQLEYSLITRDIEREYFKMCEQMNIPILAWGPIAGGALSGKYLKTDIQQPKRLSPDSKRLNPRSTQIAKKVVELSQKLGCSPILIALKWVMKKNRNTVIPIIGARTLEQLKQSLEVINFELPDNYLDELNEVSKIEMGFPNEFLASDNVINLIWNGLQYKM